MVIEIPHNITYSKNDIRYVFQLEDLTRPGLYLQVKVWYKKLADITFAELYTFDLKPDSTGMVYFYFQNYLDSLLNYVLPTVGAIVTGADDQARQFYIDWREITDADPDPDWNTEESGNVRTVIKGGVEKNKFSRNNIFLNYIDIQKPFLTWQPAGHFVFYDENVFLSFLNPQVSGANLKLKIVCTATDLTTDTQTTTFVGDKLIYHLNVGPQALAFTTGFITKQNFYYDISITDNAGTTTLINAYRLYSEYRPAYKFYDLIYFNSITGVDSVRVLGESDINVNRDFDEVEGGLKLNWQDPVNTFERSFTNIRLQRQYKGDIGYLRNRTKKQQESFLDFLASEDIYQLIDARWIPVINLQKAVDLGKSTDTIQSFPIEWSLSESNVAFTPDDKTFGAGLDFIPTNLSETSITSYDETRSTIVFDFDEPDPAAPTYTIRMEDTTTHAVTTTSGGHPLSALGEKGHSYSCRIRANYLTGSSAYSSPPIIVDVPA